MSEICEIISHKCICVSGGFSYMKSRELKAPALVHYVYDVCNLIYKKIFSLVVFGYFDSYHIVLNFHTFYLQISFIFRSCRDTVDV